METNVNDYLRVGTHDKTQDIQDAINACNQSGGGAVYLPSGIYPVTQLTLPSRITLYGDNPYATILESITATDDVLTLTGRGSRICNLGFQSTVPRTSGRYLYLTPTSRACYINNFLMEGAFIGVQVGCGATCHVEHGEILNGSSLPDSCGVLVTEGFDLFLANLTMDNPANAQPAAGIKVTRCGDLHIRDCDIIHCTNDLHITGGFSIYVDSCFFDTANVGILLQALTPIERCHFNGCWTASHTSHGVLISPDAPAKVDTIDFINHHTFFNGGDGVHLGKGNNLKVEGSSCCANLSGIGVGGNAQHVILSGNKSGSTGSMMGNQYGIYLIDPCDYVILSNNDLLGNQINALVGHPAHLAQAANLM